MIPAAKATPLKFLVNDKYEMTAEESVTIEVKEARKADSIANEDIKIVTSNEYEPEIEVLDPNKITVPGTHLCMGLF